MKFDDQTQLNCQDLTTVAGTLAGPKTVSPGANPRHEHVPGRDTNMYREIEQMLTDPPSLGMDAMGPEL